MIHTATLLFFRLDCALLFLLNKLHAAFKILYASSSSSLYIVCTHWTLSWWFLSKQFSQSSSCPLTFCVCPTEKCRNTKRKLQEPSWHSSSLLAWLWEPRYPSVSAPWSRTVAWFSVWWRGTLTLVVHRARECFHTAHIFVFPSCASWRTAYGIWNRHTRTKRSTLWSHEPKNEPKSVCNFVYLYIVPNQYLAIVYGSG